MGPGVAIDRAHLEAMGKQLGLEVFGVTDPGDSQADMRALQRWLALGKHAGMGFLAAHQSARADPNHLLTGIRAVIMVGLSYGCGDRLSDVLRATAPRVAQYARFSDYHRELRKLSLRLAEEVLAPQGLPFRVVVDTAPFFERATAARTGAGFIGKNTLWIHPTRGSWFVLAAILVAGNLAPLAPAPPHTTPGRRDPQKGGCGSCRRCQVHCPTGALQQDYVLDARRCLAYYTIEHRGLIPVSLWKWLPKMVFGCDICQLVCPYNRSATPTRRPQQVPATLDPMRLLQMTQREYEAWFGATPLTRAKRRGLRRNALVALLASAGDSPQLRAAAFADPDWLLVMTYHQALTPPEDARAGKPPQPRSISKAKEVVEV